MKKLMMIMALTATQLIASLAVAETTVGNGGDLVVCRNSQNKITSVELLDYFEARELRGIVADIASTDQAIDRLKRLSPKRAERYRAAIADFNANALFKSGVELTDVPDSDHDLLPAGCKIEQLAIQRKPQFPEDKLYLINKDLWDLMSARDQAGLKLHEIIYRDTLDAGKTDSKTSRYFNSLISSVDFQQLTGKAYVKIVASVFNATIAAGELQPQPGVLCDENVESKLLFVVDTSGSNTMSDPQRQRIRDVQSFIRANRSNPHCQWSLMSLGNSESQSLTTDAQGNATFVRGSDIEKSLSQLGATVDTGGTPYRSALQLIQQMIQNSGDLSGVRIVFISDGTPTDYQTSSEVLSALQAILGTNTQFNSVFYGQDNKPAEKLLSDMAAIGQGKYLRAQGAIDFGQLLH